jgi:hypothetical protein
MGEQQIPKVDRRELWCLGVDWFLLAQDKFQWWNLV